MYPKGTAQHSGFLSVFLQKVSEDDARATTFFSILDSSNTKKNSLGNRKFLKYSNLFRKTSGIAQFVSLDTLNSQSTVLLPNDSLTIVCDITILGPEKTVTVSPNFQEQKKRKLDLLSQDLEDAFGNKEFSDVKIHCGDKVFDCHQFMLSARSPVFRVMFQADMTEKKTKKVEIMDLQPDVVAEMLSFIYVGKTTKLDELSGELLAAAEKY